MCVVSMVGDFYRDTIPQKPYWPNAEPLIMNPGIYPHPPTPITRDEFNDLKKTVEGMKELLKRAKEYDEKNGEPDCEIDEKVDFIKKVAKFVGVEIDIK